MGTQGAFACLLLCAGIVIAHGADSPPFIPPAGLFSLARSDIRPPAPSSTPEVSDGDASPRFALGSAASSAGEPVELAMQRHQMIYGSPLLFRPEREIERGGVYGWSKTHLYDAVLKPEVVKFKKVEVTGGVVAAIKRKNPLCLLNPFVFGIDW